VTARPQPNLAPESMAWARATDSDVTTLSQRVKAIDSILEQLERTTTASADAARTSATAVGDQVSSVDERVQTSVNGFRTGVSSQGQAQWLFRVARVTLDEVGQDTAAIIDALAFGVGQSASEPLEGVLRWRVRFRVRQAEAIGTAPLVDFQAERNGGSGSRRSPPSTVTI